VVLPPIETSQERIRMALDLLDELEQELRALGSTLPQRYHLVRMLAATRRQLEIAVAAVESQRRTARWWVGSRSIGERCSSAVSILLEVVAWGVFVIRFALRCAWWCIWGLGRVVRTLRGL
jgi:hypothetical protein